MLKKVKLYGELAEKYGKEWELDIESPSEAIRALMANNPSFRQFVSTSEERGVGYKVIVGNNELVNITGELSNPTGRQDIKIVPVIGGAKRGIGQIIVGALMIYIAIQTGVVLADPGSVAVLAGEGSGVIMGTALSSTGMMAVKFGGALILGGIAAMLAPTPPTLSDAAKAENYSFNGADNTTRQGGAIPVCYGQLMVGGAVISSGVSPEDYTP